MNFEEVIENIKQANPIEDVIAEDEPLRGHGRYWTGSQHDSLVVDTHRQLYVWNSRKGSGDRGDVFTWLEVHRGLDFKAAAELLARRANLPEPTWGKQDMEQRVSARAREEVFQVAAGVFQTWLLNDKTAMAYANGRGWTDETIREAMLGYTGTRQDRQEKRQALRDALVLEGHKEDDDDPVVVALLGYDGDVASWATRHNIDVSKKWVEDKHIPGLVGMDALVYAHVRNGRVEYFSSRFLNPYDPKNKSYNLPRSLVGEKRLYFNHVWTPRADSCVIVEGQADAVTLAQWGIPGIALGGVAASEDLKRRTAHHKKIFVALDSDTGGRNNLSSVCETVHPLSRTLDWIDSEFRTYIVEGETEPREVKDANDYARSMSQGGLDNSTQLSRVQGRMVNALSYLEHIAADCGETADQSDRDAKELDVLKQYIQLSETEQTQYRDRIAMAMKRRLASFDRMVKQLQGKGDSKDDDRPDKIIPIWGGYHDGHLFEYLFDPKDKTAMLAYKEMKQEDGTPGQVKKAAYVDVWNNGTRTRYVPEEPYDYIYNEAVLFPSDIGELKSDREIVAILEQFFRRYYLFDDPTLPRIIAYYVLMTWLYDAFNAVAYLRALGSAGCGKTELMRRIGYVCYRGIKMSGSDTAASIFRTIEEFRGTLIIDEYDQEGGGDTTSDFVKVLNMGAMKDGQVTRMMEYVDVEGNKRMRPGSYSTYCPKLLNGRKDMKDDAVASRCLTFFLMPSTQLELTNAGVPSFMDEDFRHKALYIRNLMLRWRMERWLPEIEIKTEDFDMQISPRLNQVTVPMKAIARVGGDEAVLDDLTNLLRELYAQEVRGRAELKEARVIEALWKIFLLPHLHKKHFFSTEGMLAIYPGSVTETTNELMDRMNAAGMSKSGEKEGGPEMSSRKVGEIMRQDLQLKQLRRTRDGIPYGWHETKMISHAVRYGVDWQKMLAHVMATRPSTLIPDIVLDLAERMKVAAAIDSVQLEEDKEREEAEKKAIEAEIGTEEEENHGNE